MPPTPTAVIVLCLLIVSDIVAFGNRLWEVWKPTPVANFLKDLLSGQLKGKGPSCLGSSPVISIRYGLKDFLLFISSCQFSFIMLFGSPRLNGSR